MKFEKKVVLITGSHHGIGRKTKELFEKEGAIVCGIDKQAGEFFTGDLKDPKVIEAYVDAVVSRYGRIDIIVNNAKPAMRGIHEGNYEAFMEALAVGVGAPFYLVHCALPYLTKGAAIINISSSRDHQSQAESESYSAAKGGIKALTHALAVSLGGQARVNSISPGWIDTEDRTYEGPDALQHPVRRVGRTEDIAHMILFLASDEAGFITGENIRIDGGMSRLMIYHDDDGWTYRK